jgi:hypothetical protein
MIENPLSPHAPLNHVPAALVPFILEILGQDAAASTAGIHEKTVELSGSDYDQLLVLYYHAFCSPFYCEDPHKKMRHTLSFVDKPAVMRETVSDRARQYTVHVKLMKLPDVPSDRQ